MTVGELTDYYIQTFGRTWSSVELRSDQVNTDGSMRRARTCICGGCGIYKTCVCGGDVVEEGRNCMVCRRPWWCTR